MPDLAISCPCGLSINLGGSFTYVISETIQNFLEHHHCDFLERHPSDRKGPTP